MWCAPATFRMEQEYGRARVYAQWVNTEEELEEAVQSCPVNCIHWVDKDDLPALEYAMQYKVPRVNVGLMGGGAEPPDVFAIAQEYLRQRQRASEEREQRRKERREEEQARCQQTDAMAQSHHQLPGSAFLVALARQMRHNLGIDWLTQMLDQFLANRARSEAASATYEIPVERALVPVARRDKSA